MYLSEINVRNDVLFAIYLVAGIFFTFAALPLKAMTFYVFGYLAASLGVEYLLDWAETEFDFAFNVNVWWGILTGCGTIGGLISGSNDKPSQFLTVCIPTFLLLSFLWQAVDVRRYRIMPNDTYLKQMICAITVTLIATLLVMYLNHVYDKMLMFSAAFFGSYLLVVAATLGYKIMYGITLIRIAPTDLMNYRRDDQQGFDVLVLGVMLLSWLGVGLLGALVQHIEWQRMTRKREEDAARRRSSKKRESTRSRRSTRVAETLFASKYAVERETRRASMPVPPVAAESRRSSMAENPAFAKTRRPSMAEPTAVARTRRPSMAEPPLVAGTRRSSMAEPAGVAGTRRSSMAEPPSVAGTRRSSMAEPPAVAETIQPSMMELTAVAETRRSFMEEPPVVAGWV